MSKWHAYSNLGIDHIEATGSRNNAANTRGRPFAKGNPGRPKGARGRTTLAAQMLLDGEAELITRKCIELAKDGDPVALRLCMERLVPPRKEWPVQFTMPPLQSGSDLTAAMAAILQAASEGKILLSQAVEFTKLLELYSRTASFVGTDDLSSLTDEELRARIERRLAGLGDVDLDWSKLRPRAQPGQAAVKNQVTRIERVIIEAAPTDAGPQAD